MKKILKRFLIFILLLILFLYSDLLYLVPFELLGIKYESLNYNLQVFCSLISSIVTLIVFVLIYRKYLKEKFIDYKKHFNEYFDLGIKIWFIGLIGMCVSNVLIATFTPVDQATNETLVQDMLHQAPILSFISASLVAPFVEEMLFRKVLGDIFTNKKVMVIMSGLVFGLLHVIFSFQTAFDFLYVIPYGFLGSSFAYIMYKKDNIFIPITFHMLHNGILTIISIISMVL